MENQNRVQRRSRIEMLFIGVFLGMLTMFGIVAVQFYSGLMDGKQFQNRITALEKTVRTIDERLKLGE